MLEQELLKIQYISEDMKVSLETRTTEFNDINNQLLAKQDELKELRNRREEEKQNGTLVQFKEESQVSFGPWKAGKEVEIKNEPTKHLDSLIRALLAVENERKNRHKKIKNLRNEVEEALGLELKYNEEEMEKLPNENEKLQMQLESALQEMRSNIAMTTNNWEDLLKDLQRETGHLESQMSDRNDFISSLENESSSTGKNLKSTEQELREKKELLKKQRKDAAASEVAFMNKLQACADEHEEGENHYRRLLGTLEADVVALNRNIEKGRSAAEKEFSSQIL
ncbi:hypothetical protein BSKO_05624 [Bryopsis sp. KO-2023]|nr:hypothetical protein BSKO_05624 [Bryopsis sp. KO-2023]